MTVRPALVADAVQWAALRRELARMAPTPIYMRSNCG